MRRILPSLLAIAALALSVGCKKDAEKTEPTAEPTEPAEPAPPTEEPPAPPSADDRMANKMANCPSAVFGAETAIESDAEAVFVTVMSKDEAAIAEIKKRAAHLAKVHGTVSEEIKHTGAGTGGGGMGKCPTLMPDTSMTVEDSAGGVKITLKPTGTVTSADLAKAVAERKENMPKAEPPAPEGAAPPSGGHGSGTGGGEGGGNSDRSGDESGKEEAK